MKKRILWFGLSFLLVAALVLASCGEAVPGEQEEEEEEEEEVPQYGGTLTTWFAFSVSGVEPASPDIHDGYFAPLMWLTPMQEKPLMGDFEKYGPRGTDEYQFLLQAFLPEKYQTGQLLEDWEVTPEETIWHVRPGVYWAADNVDFMENRELTAADVVADLLYLADSPARKTFFEDTIGDIYTTDKYTLIMKTPGGFDESLMYILGYEDRAIISPPEMEVAGMDKWENQVGTGPWMFKEYVVGSHMAFEKNPNYWDTTTINGVEYELPFIDELIWPIIPDESTQIAALRTGELDWMLPVPNVYWPDLDETAPGVLSNRYATTTGHQIGLKCSEPPFDDMEVRRAMMIGTNRQAFYDLQDVGALPLHWWPNYSGDPGKYTPLEELPAETRLLFDYNPTLAMDMLEDALGPPDADGYFLEIDLTTLNQPRFQERAELLKDIWEDIGVIINIKAVDATVFADTVDGQKYSGAYLGEASGGENPSWGLGMAFGTGSYFNVQQYSNPLFDELIADYLAEIDFVERDKLAKEMGVLVLNEVSRIPTAPLKEAAFWWPWLKNYYGEIAAADYNFIPIHSRMWIDEDLKEEMGF